MRRDQELKLKQFLSELNTNERLKLYKQAAHIRKVNRSRSPQREESKHRTASLDEIVLQLLETDQSQSTIEGPTSKGIVKWIGLKTCRVTTQPDQMVYELPKPKGVAIGDDVLVSRSGSRFSIESILPRRTVLSRPDVGSKYVEQVIAANVDKVVLVVSVGSPPLHPRIIDRYMIAIMKGGAKMVLAVNKCDLLTSENRGMEMDKLKPYERLMPIVECSTLTGDGLETLRGFISGQVCVFVGHSGVGKSSLANSISPELQLATGEVSQGYGRGTHTTTASTMYQLSDGTQVIDTPGIRSFGLWDIPKEELAFYFPEFDSFQSGCKFRNCSHTHEPACAVKEAALSGKISAARYDAYMRILTLD